MSPPPSPGGGFGPKLALATLDSGLEFVRVPWHQKLPFGRPKVAKKKGFRRSCLSYFEGRSQKCESMFYLHGSSLFEPPRVSETFPNRSQLASEIAPGTRVCEQDAFWRSKMLQNSSQMSLQTSPRPSSRVVRFYTSALFAKITPKIRKMNQDASQNAAKLAILGSKLANIAPSWNHFGPAWAILPTR